MSNCALCFTKLKFVNTPNFGAGNLNDGNRICTSCFKKLNKIDSNFTFNLKQHSLQEAKELIVSKPETNSNEAFPLKGCLFIIIIVVILFFTVKSCFFTKDEAELQKEIERKEQKEKDAKNLEIISKAQVCVQKNLKSPSTAEFDYFDSNVWQLNDSTYMVKGSVDAQNEFGAMLRAYYECEITLLQNDNFRCVNVTIIQQ